MRGYGIIHLVRSQNIPWYAHRIKGKKYLFFGKFREHSKWMILIGKGGRKLPDLGKIVQNCFVRNPYYKTIYGEHC